MIGTRMVFLFLTGLLLALLIAISVVTLKKSRKQQLEEPKHRMLEDD